MDIDHDYDPLQALAVRISTPAEQEFLRANIRHIEKEFGTAMSADLARALSLDDFEAAIRFSAALCSEAEFTPTGERTYSWTIDGISASGTTSLKQGTEAKALVAASICAHAAALRHSPSPAP